MTLGKRGFVDWDVITTTIKIIGWYCEKCKKLTIFKNRCCEECGWEDKEL